MFNINIRNHQINIVFSNICQVTSLASGHQKHNFANFCNKKIKIARERSEEWKLNFCFIRREHVNKV